MSAVFLPRLVCHPPLRTLVTAMLMGLATPLSTVQAQTPVQLPALGDSVSEDFDILAERKLGDRIMREVRRDPSVEDDPLLLAHVDSIWQALLAAARERGDITPDLDRAFAWEPFLVRDKAVNAMAFPGGYIGVLMGLIAMTGSRDELASVLGHELTHVNQRHIARSMVSSSKVNLATTAAMLLGVLAAARGGNVDALSAVVATGQAAMAQHQLNFSREMEREADRIGVDLLVRAGFAPSGMAAMFEKLDQNSRLNDSNQFPYLRSHPLTIERIAEARLRTRELPTPEVRAAEVTQHLLMQARAKVLMDPSEPALRQHLAFADKLSVASNTDQQLAAWYAAGLAALQLRDAPAMERAHQRLQNLARGLPPASSKARATLQYLRIQQLLPQIKTNGAAQAELTELLHSIASLEDRPARLLRAEVALAQSRAGLPTAQAGLRAAMESLQLWVSDHRSDASAWQALGQCARSLGLFQRAQRAEAEAAYASGDLLGAYDRLKVARAMPSGSPGQDDVEAAVVATRMREWEPQRRRLLAEMRGEKIQD